MGCRVMTTMIDWYAMSFAVQFFLFGVIATLIIEILILFLKKY